MASSMKASVTGSSAAIAGTPVRSTVRVTTCRARSSICVQAAESNRREMLVGAALATGLAAAPALAGIEALVPTDDRKAKGTIAARDEALDFDVDIRARRGEVQFRQSLEDTKKRVAESKKRFAAAVKPNLDKSYWTQGREALRLQMGYLRYDLNTLAKSKADKESIKGLNQQIEKLDYAMRVKDLDSAKAEYDKAISLLDSVTSGLL